MMNQNRRQFLKRSALMPVGVSMGATGIGSISSSTSPSEGKPAKIRLSLNAWSFQVPLFKYVNGEAGGMSLFDLLDVCARLDLDAVDPTGYFFPGYPDVPDRSFINAFKRQAFRLGLSISGTGIRNDFSTADRSKREADISRTKKWIEAAAEIGAPVIRVFAGNQPEGHSWDEAASWLSDALATCAEHGAKNGVIVGIQNHGGMLKSADEVLKILRLVNSEWLGVIVDTGYMLTPDPYEDIKRVIPYAVNWQVKEMLQNRKGGMIDLDKLVGLILASDYRGFVPIETLPMPGKEEEYDAHTRVPAFLSEVRRALGRAK